MSIEVLAISSDNLIRLDALTNASSGAFINSATVTFTLLDASGAVVDALSNVTMGYIASSNGRYEGNVPNNAGLIANAYYTIQVTAVSGGLQIFRKLSCIAKYRSNQ